MFGFPKVDHSIKESFTRNFLRTVIIQIKFEENNKLFENKSKVLNFFQEKYPRLHDNISNNFEIQFQHHTPIVNASKGKGFLLKNNDGSKTINFTSDTIEININGFGYKNFSEIQDFEIEKIKNVLVEFGIAKVNRIAVRKVNIIGLRINENTNLTQISKGLLNERLSYNFETYPMEEYIQQNVSSVNYVKGLDGLNLKSGLTVQPGNTMLGHVICDIDRYCSDVNDSSNLSEMFKKINEEIFDIFLWFLNNRSLKILRDDI